MKINLKPIQKNTATLIFTAKAVEVKKAKNIALQTLGKNVQVKGFRKGKAPISLVNEKLDPAKVRQYTINTLLKSHLPQVIKEKKLDLIGNPQLTKIDTLKNKAWVITLELPLMPKVILGDYETKVKTALNAKRNKSKSNNQKINLVCDSLLKEIQLEVSQVLVQSEIQKSFSRLINQIQSLGVSLDQYLKSINKTVKQIKLEYKKQAEANLKLEFILIEIAKEKKLIVTDKEVEDFINATGDAKIKESLSDPSQLPYIKTIFMKRKAIDSLLSR